MVYEDKCRNLHISFPRRLALGAFLPHYNSDSVPDLVRFTLSHHLSLRTYTHHLSNPHQRTPGTHPVPCRALLPSPPSAGLGPSLASPAERRRADGCA